MSLQEEMIQKELFEARMETELEDTAKRIYSKGLKELNNNEAYYVLLSFVKDYARVTEEITGEKKIYYISAEFLIGKLLSNNLINLGAYDKVKEILAKNGLDLPKSKRLNPNLLWVTADSEDWLHVSLIPSQRSDFPVTVSV